MYSYWEKTSFQRFEYIIVGGGIVGLSVAASIKEKSKESTVLVIDQGLFPTGASVKNAGFACFGSLSEIVDDLQMLNPEQVCNLVNDRYEGLQKLIHRLGVEALGYFEYGGYDLLTNENADCLDQIDRVNKMLLPLFNREVFSLQNQVIPQFGFSNEAFKYAVHNPLEGQIDTGKMMSALIEYVGALGVHRISNTQVESYAEDANEVQIKLNNNEQTFYADKIALCTNAFTKTLFPEVKLNPGRGQVLVTKPIAGLNIKGCFHIEGGYYYFRNISNRIIFGGGRNLDKQGEQTTSEGINPKIETELKRRLKEDILPKAAYEIDYSWSGIMAFGEDKRPVCQRLSDRVYAALRLGGMGIALGSKLGTDLALEMIEL